MTVTAQNYNDDEDNDSNDVRGLSCDILSKDGRLAANTLEQVWNTHINAHTAHSTHFYHEHRHNRRRCNDHTIPYPSSTSSSSSSLSEQTRRRLTSNYLTFTTFRRYYLSSLFSSSFMSRISLSSDPSKVSTSRIPSLSSSSSSSSLLSCGNPTRTLSRSTILTSPALHVVVFTILLIHSGITTTTKTKTFTEAASTFNHNTGRIKLYSTAYVSPIMHNRMIRTLTNNNEMKSHTNKKASRTLTHQQQPQGQAHDDGHYYSSSNSLEGDMIMPIHHDHDHKHYTHSDTIPTDRTNNDVQLIDTKGTFIGGDITPYADITLDPPSHHHQHLPATAISNIFRQNINTLTPTPAPAPAPHFSQKITPVTPDQNKNNAYSTQPSSSTIPERQRLLGSIRNSWKRRHARSIEEGIRRDKNDSDRGKELSSILEEFSSEDGKTVDGSGRSGDQSKRDKGGGDPTKGKGKGKVGSRYVARTIAGLISALAEESTGLEVEVDAQKDTPLWGKQVDELRIEFSRLGFDALKMGGLDDYSQYDDDNDSTEGDNTDDREDGDATEKTEKTVRPPSRTTFDNLNQATFDSIDTDNSGALDEKELTRALIIASGVVPQTLSKNTTSIDTSIDKSMEVLSRLASRLLVLYDANGDGVVDREEYKDLVKDMAALRNVQRMRLNQRKRRKQMLLVRRKRHLLLETKPAKWGRGVGEALALRLNRVVTDARADNGFLGDHRRAGATEKVPASTNGSNDPSIDFEGAEDISNNPSILGSIGKRGGTIVLSDLKLDLRRLLVGGIPIVKRITPGGPLVLEPFTTTITCSFDKKDMMESGLLLDGLSRLVTRALRRRVRSIRDLADGAVFFGRAWNMASAQAPVVEVPELTSIEFDSKDRAIITGRARIRTAPDQPVIENSFKLRTKLGTRDDGQVIGLSEPELALVLECPKMFERNIVSMCKQLNLPIPTRPEPLFTYFPLVSPLKKTEQDGFNLGEDNKIRSIYIKNGALRLELSVILRPGRFLGNHYLAFTVPNRTFIITTDRVREGIKVARRNKRIASRQDEMIKKEIASDLYTTAFVQSISTSAIGTYVGGVEELFNNSETIEEDHSFLESKLGGGELEVESVNDNVVANKPGFFSRFLEGYLEAAREETETEQLTTAISEFFGSSGSLDGEDDIDTLDGIDELD